VRHKNCLPCSTFPQGKLRRRETHLIKSLALRLRKRIGDGIDPNAAFVEVQTHAAAAAQSHVDTLVLDEFATAVSQVADRSVAHVLDKLRALHGLSRIRDELAWFQEHGQMSGTTAISVRKQHDRLVSEIAAESLAVVDSFSIPDEVLAAPIATRTE
jgi:acyl-CoA oxidase